MMTENEKWKLVDRLLKDGMRPVDIARKLKTVSAQQIYSRRAAQKKKKQKKDYYTDPKNAVYHTPEYKAWRLAVFRRDGFKCRYCGSKRKLEADHILPQSIKPELRFDVNNGRTLCKSCHKKTVTYGFQSLKYKGRL